MKTIYTGGRVFTGSLPLAEAFAVEDGRFCAVGSDAELLARRGAEDVIVPLNGRFVCAGFNDSHMHLLNYGNAMEACPMAECTGSLAALQSGLRAFLQAHPPAEGGWLRGRGWNQDYFAPATGMPTRHDLDAVTTEHPVCIVRCCGHCLVVNTRALELLGIDGSTPQPEGGSFDLDEQGQPTGVFRDTAMSLVSSRLPAPTREELKRMLRCACRALNAYGVTSCHTDDLCCFENVPWREVIEAYRELEAEGALTVRVYEQSQHTTVASLQDFLDSGFCTGRGSDRFRIGPLKVLGDGSLGARTALLRDGYADAPQEHGLAIFPQEELDALVGLAIRSGMQVAVHAIGDGILDQVLTAYERALGEAPARDHRCGVVHVQLTRPDQLERMQRLGLHAYVQTIFLDYDTRIVHQRAGEALASTSYAFHTLRTLGLHVSNGTDCPVELPDPLRGVQCAVTRRPLDGSLPAYRPEEAMSVAEALCSYTSESAFASFEEAVKGRIAPGMYADFTVLTGNPFETAPEALASLRAEATYLGGACVYSAAR